MKKVLLMVIRIILGLFVLAGLFVLWQSYRQLIPKAYTEKTETGGDIEKKYLAMGSHKVSSVSIKRDDSLKKILVFYPEDIRNTDKTYPLVVYSNGTGQKGSQYKNLYRHLASWGFIIAANDDPQSYSGLPAEKTLGYMLEENGREGSIFHGKIDLENIGTYGHSQGGAAVYNTITAQQHSSVYKTAVALSPTCEELADALGWHFDLSAVKIPVFIAAGTAGDFEINTVIPYEKLLLMYDHLQVPKAMARRTGAEHANTVCIADGYVTAWFMWHLQGDAEAARAFTGSDPELLKNPLYQHQQIDY